MKKAYEIRRDYPNRRYLVSLINSIIWGGPCNEIDIEELDDLRESLRYGDKLHVWDNLLPEYDYSYFERDYEVTQDVVAKQLDLAKEDIVFSEEELGIDWLLHFSMLVPRYFALSAISSYLQNNPNNIVIIGNINKDFKVVKELDAGLSTKSKVNHIDNTITNIVYTTISDYDKLSDCIDGVYFLISNVEGRYFFTEMLNNKVINNISINTEMYNYILKFLVWRLRVNEVHTKDDYSKLVKKYITNTVTPIISKGILGKLEGNYTFLLPPENVLNDGISVLHKGEDKQLGYEYPTWYEDIPLKVDSISKLKTQLMSVINAEYVDSKILELRESDDYWSVKAPTYPCSVANLEINEATLPYKAILGSVIFIADTLGIMDYINSKWVAFTANTPYIFRAGSNVIIRDMIIPWVYSFEKTVVKDFKEE